MHLTAPWKSLCSGEVSLLEANVAPQKQPHFKRSKRPKKQDQTKLLARKRRRYSLRLKRPRETTPLSPAKLHVPSSAGLHTADCRIEGSVWSLGFARLLLQGAKTPLSFVMSIFARHQKNETGHWLCHQHQKLSPFPTALPQACNVCRTWEDKGVNSIKNIAGVHQVPYVLKWPKLTMVFRLEGTGPAPSTLGL